MSKLTPPSFLAHAANDKMENSIAYFQALRKNGVQAEVHISAETWTARCEDWLRKQSYLAK